MWPRLQHGYLMHMSGLFQSHQVLIYPSDPISVPLGSSAVSFQTQLTVANCDNTIATVQAAMAHAACCL